MIYSAMYMTLWPILLSFVTAILGATKNHVKYKQFNPFLFLRTPAVVFILSIIVNNNINAVTILICERWLMLSYKTILAYCNDNHTKKKDKYVLKYGMKYDE